MVPINDLSKCYYKLNSNTEDWIARLGIDMTIPDYDITWSNKVYMKAPTGSYEEL